MFIINPTPDKQRPKFLRSRTCVSHRGIMQETAVLHFGNSTEQCNLLDIDMRDGDGDGGDGP